MPVPSRLVPVTMTGGPGRDPFADAAASARRLAERTGEATHDVAVVLGSGWAPAADALAGSGTEIPVARLGGFPPATVPGHAGVVRSVRVGSLRVLVFLGRVHLYEGHLAAAVVHGVRTAVAAGCQVVVLTNAAGSLHDDWLPGQPVLVSDHLNLTGQSPLTGALPPEGYPSRFTDLSGLYSPRLRELALAADPGLLQGVYAALPGPHYETPAEIRMLRVLGADLVGMSTALEAIAARHLGAEVLAVSLVTNLAAGLAPPGHAPGTIEHGDVVAAGQAAAAWMGKLLAAFLPGCLPERTGGAA
jgi:purine-nucleoside phosphorylase